MISLQKIDARNLWKVTGLAVHPTQRDYVATNTESLLEAYAALSEGRAALPFAICSDGLLVGFVMFGYGTIGDEDEPSVAKGNYCIWRFMIDARYQGMGYGREALAASLKYLRTLPLGPAEACWLSYEPENLRARELYSSFGFQENGESDGTELVAVLPL